ncbi:FtsX-like permease family protein [Vagococcus lutrae]|uniref:FtsX-like permease family protein n=1 Tax=Vagococcus lutrae TaxID=81947 RepID=UPI0023A9AF46|nr:FtsX-like permease family protein [Vagococcus lutrae]WEB81654.1 hypothetical protein LVJ09_01460 [Vagococcus lutrae]
MTFRQLIFRNVFRNGRSFASYYFSSTFSIMIFFLVSTIAHHPMLKKEIDTLSYDPISLLTAAAFGVAQVVIILMSIIFLGYAFNIFIKSREQDLATYLILGMSPYKLKIMLIAENMIIACASFISGISIGLLFTKFLFLIAQTVLLLEQPLTMYWPQASFNRTLKVYGTLFFIITIVTLIRLKSKKLNLILHTQGAMAPPPKHSWLLGITSLLCIGVGYRLVWEFVNQDYYAYPLLLLMGVLITILGTYLFFKQFTILVLSRIKKHPSIYRGRYLLVTNQLLYRIKDNANMYFLIATFAAIAFVATGTTLSLNGSEFAGQTELSFAYTYQYQQDKTLPDVSKLHEQNIDIIEQEIKKAGYDYIKQTPDTRIIVTFTDDSTDTPTSMPYQVLSLSTYNEMARFKKEETLSLKSDNDLYLMTGTAFEHDETSKIVPLNHVSHQTIYYQGSSQKMTVHPRNHDYRFEWVNPTVIVTDKMYEEISQHYLASTDKQTETLSAPTEHLTLIHFNEWQQAANVYHAVEKKLGTKSREINQKLDLLYNKTQGHQLLTSKESQQLQQLEQQSFSLSSLYFTWLTLKQTNGLILIVSFLLGAVFFVFAASISYFRLFGGLKEEADYYQTLYFIGVGPTEQKRIVSIELFLMFFLPLIIATSHFTMATFALKRLLGATTLVKPWLQVIMWYFFFQSLFFFFSRRRYLFHLKTYAK